MKLFNKKSKQNASISLPKAQKVLGIHSEEELRKRAMILLNDELGIVEADPNAKLKMEAYRSGKMPEIKAFQDEWLATISKFTGYYEGANHICWCINFNDINMENIIDASIKVSFCPTEHTPLMVGFTAINDGALASSGEVACYGLDAPFNLAHPSMRVLLYELIVFPDCEIDLIDENDKGKTENFAYQPLQFVNSFAVRSNFLREAEAYMNALETYSIFTLDFESAGNLFRECFSPNGEPIALGAKDFYEKRMQFDPKPRCFEDWMGMSI